MNTDEMQSVKIDFREDITKLHIEENCSSVPVEKESMIEFILETEN